jgi:hypothetical protein
MISMFCMQELAEDCLSLCDGGAGLGLEKEPEALELAAILRCLYLLTFSVLWIPQ